MVPDDLGKEEKNIEMKISGLVLLDNFIPYDRNYFKLVWSVYCDLVEQVEIIESDSG